MKKTAHSKAKKVTRSRSSSKSSSISLMNQYRASRSTFFQAHKNMQILLGVFVAVFALFIVVSVWGQMQVYNYEWQTAVSSF